MARELTPQSTVNDFQWRLDVSITLRQSESDADIRTNGQWESAKCSQRALNPVNTRGVYWGFHPAITVNDGTYETLFSRRVCSLHTSCKYSVTPAGWLMARMRVTPVCKPSAKARFEYTTEWHSHNEIITAYIHFLKLVAGDFSHGATLDIVLENYKSHIMDINFFFPEEGREESNFRDNLEQDRDSKIAKFWIGKSSKIVISI